MRKNAFNVFVFMILSTGMIFLWYYAETNIAKKNKPKEPPAQVEDEKQKTTTELLVAAGGGLAVGLDIAKPSPKPPEPPKIVAPPPQDPPTLIALGNDNFYNRALLTTRGGGVQQVVLTRFDQADRLGREVKVKDADGKPTKQAVPLHLIPGVVTPRGKVLREEYILPALQPGKVADPSQLAEPSYTLFMYPTSEDKIPDPFLGETNWTVVAEERPEDGEHKVVFEKELGEPHYIKVRKIYTLGPKDYHIGLRLEFERLKVPGFAKGKAPIRFQLSGPRGLPIEGEWYTSTYRVAVTGWMDRNNAARRQYEDTASIGAKRGGDAVVRGDNTFKYMAVANQFFASGVAIDNEAESKGAVKHPWSYVRATTELPFDKKQDVNMPNFDDITVRAAFEPIDLAPGEKLAHSYLLYNGPSKVRLLGLMSGDESRRVAPELVKRYKEDLSLQTITDFRSDTWIGRFANAIYWSDLVITFTNLMHWLLALIHAVIPSWALSIVVLTVMVRLLLIVPSRKQTAMSMKMMEVQKKLQPEFEKLQEKYKDDFQTYNREKTRLMMQNGANPFAMMGGCLLLLAQMPIMMGLYFCLQESVFFRLDSFLWINNLAAPDMLAWWSEKIPYVSTPEDIGSMIYLGPYFNILPILAVALMLYQQSKMMPPSTDPQAETQRTMMKMMMVMMAVFFYKVAAGLTLYFIISTLWGILERALIPKPVVDGSGSDNATTTNTNTLNPTANAAVAAAQQKSKGLLGRLRAALQEKMEEMQRRADEQSRRQIRNDPNSGSPPGGGTTNPQQNQNRRDKKKKRRK